MQLDIINKSLKDIGFTRKNIINLINDSYYFGYKWKYPLTKFTNYTHLTPKQKLITNNDYLILEKITIDVVIHNFKLVHVDVYMSARININFQFTSDYQNNICIVEQYMLNNSNKDKVIKYVFKILEYDNIFTILDSNYNIVNQNSFLESLSDDGYLKSSININDLIENFIIPN